VGEQAAEAARGLAVRWRETLTRAWSDRRAGATGLAGKGGSWPVQVSGAQARRRCQIR